MEFTSVSDGEALEAVRFFARHEGVVFALESAHAGWAGLRLAETIPPERAIVINMSGRGDKDLFILAPSIDGESWGAFLAEEARKVARETSKIARAHPYN